MSLALLQQIQRLGAPYGLAAAILCWAPQSFAQAPSGAASFAPPPRSISDITAILDQEKPDPGKVAKLTGVANAQPPANADDAAMVAFLGRRGSAAVDLGRTQQALADLRKAVAISRSHPGAKGELVNAVIELSRAERRAGNVAEGNRLLQEGADMARASGVRLGAQFSAFATLAVAAAEEGKFEEAHSWLKKEDDLFLDSASWKGAAARFQTWFRYLLDHGYAVVLDLEGKFGEAEPRYRRAITEARQAEIDAAGVAGDNSPPPNAYVTSADFCEEEFASALARRGRLLEAEVESREALLSQLHIRGRYAVESTAAVTTLTRIIGMQGRYSEAEKLARTAVETDQTLGVADDSTVLSFGRSLLASTLLAQGRTKEALATYAQLVKSLANNEPVRRQYLGTNPDYAIASLKSGDAATAVAVAQAMIAERSKASGDTSYATAEAEGIYGAALATARKPDDAKAAFAKAVPVMLAATRHNDNEEVDLSQGWQAIRLQFVLESYLGLLAASGGGGVEAFRIADAARGQNVQRAVAAAAARAKVGDAALAALVRQDQDAQRQVTALDALLANALALPSDQRDAKMMSDTRAQIEALNASRAKMRDQIRQRFPDYAQLTDPRPATVDQAQAALAPGEALVSVYLGQNGTYVWAVPKQGAVAFAVSPLSPGAVAEAVKTLRKALDPEAATAGDIPAFDVATAYKLYAGLLEPVKAGWKDAKILLVAANGALAELPFGLLATQNVAPAPDREGQPLFAGYRSVPWLIRQVAVVELPSVTALTTLRATPAVKAARKPFIGFGDPWFSKAEAAQALKEQGTALALQGTAGSGLVALRKAPVKLRSAPRTEGADSADLAALPRLPDTAAEVREVAQALGADPARDVYLGAQASEQAVRTLKLDDRRVVMFATHGLIPGDLDGLNEPALALSAPEVAQVPGDGLLTVSKILGLRLNADWVVLSACNTAAGNGAGAEAVSGLGLAFFYAGSRALLVSNWPVETNSARLLTTELFKREAAVPGITRAEALRQAMLALIDGPGLLDQQTKQPVFAFAHPIFWAPFSLVGDGGPG